MSNPNPSADPSPARGGKHLTFQLGLEEYAIPILKVHEIIGMVDVTPVPRVPDYMRGVINLRGKIIPVIDLRSKFGMTPVERTDNTCIVLVQGEAGHMGLIVDAVSEVRLIEDKDIENPPAFGTHVNTDYLLGIGKVLNRVVLLLNIDRVLSSRETFV